ncbi:SAM-dependent methyltransferas-like protein [Microdochium bolleyi]|uniref:SAM-dependent methyltransferas-like protein n=1 Tax=Microdochium bolleyi TaxID=196109 RepID=A0A136IUS5_9PEZI|nr:SAM-dependent methyltransferas-like protein [Microdochium bolleyi]
MSLSSATTTPGPVLKIADAPRLAAYHHHDPAHFHVELVQAEHRIRLVNAWNNASSSSAAIIGPGARVLELGCGQGTATTVLAEAVGPTGHVDAVDPGSLDYGAPLTLGEAQRHITDKSPVGGRIRWHQATPEAFLSSTSASGEEQWDVAVLAHCIWYFADTATLASILASLRGRVRRLCVAEYALRATHPAAVPHVLCVVARGMVESFRAQDESEENVRTPIGPRVIKGIAEQSGGGGGGGCGAGWKLVGEENVVPEAGLLDGQWEVGTVMSQYFVDEVEKHVGNEKSRDVIMTARDAVVSAVGALGEGEKPRTMDVWVAVFE